jgi:hypothetical protein
MPRSESRITYFVGSKFVGKARIRATVYLPADGLVGNRPISKNPSKVILHNDREDWRVHKTWYMTEKPFTIVAEVTEDKFRAVEVLVVELADYYDPTSKIIFTPTSFYQTKLFEGKFNVIQHIGEPGMNLFSEDNRELFNKLKAHHPSLTVPYQKGNRFLPDHMGHPLLDVWMGKMKAAKKVSTGLADTPLSGLREDEPSFVVKPHVAKRAFDLG